MRQRKKEERATDVMRERNRKREKIQIKKKKKKKKLRSRKRKRKIVREIEDGGGGDERYREPQKQTKQEIRKKTIIMQLRYYCSFIIPGSLPNLP